MTTNTKVATLKIINEIRCAVIGIKPQEHAFFYEKYGMLKKGYQFTPQFKLRKWDGKLRFYTAQGLTYIHLLPEIIPILKEMGYSLRLLDKRTASPFVMPKIDETYFSQYGITLGQHQVNQINTISEAGNGIVLAGTGAGKTISTALICDLATQHNGAKNIVIVPNYDLITQTRLELSGFGLNVGEYSGKRKTLDGDTVVSTWQALQNNPSTLGQFNSLIVDECHTVTGSVLKDLLENHAGHIAFRIALTGTLPKDATDLMTCRVLLGNVLHNTEASELIESGWLARPSIHQRCLIENFDKEYAEYCKQPIEEEDGKRLTLKGFTNKLLPDYDAERAFLASRKVRDEFIADLAYGLSQKPKGNTFIMVKNIPQGRKLASLIPGAVFLYGGDKSSVRKAIYDAFADNDNMVVITTYQLASTGLNIKRLFHLIMVDAGKSFTTVIQTIGRALRKAHDKETVEIYDLYSNLKFSRRHAKARKEYYDEKGYDCDVSSIDYTKYYNELFT